MKKGQIRYSRGYRLPRYPKHRKKEISWKRRMLFFWVLFLVLGLAYVVFFSPLFEIKEIKISNNRAISNEEIKSSLDGFLFKECLIFFNYNNLFLAAGNKLTELLTNDFPRILSVAISKDIFKKTIELNIIERKEAGIYCKEDLVSSNRGECYYIDKEGVIFEEAPQTSGTLILAIKDFSKREIETGKNVIEKEFMAELIDLKNYLPGQLGFKVLDFTIESDVLKDLKLNTNEGWYILFDGSRNLKSQLEALRLVLEEKIEERKDLEYIDLRIENRVYYK